MQIRNIEVLELEKFRTWMGDDGISRTKVRENATVLLADAKQNTEAVQTFYKGVKFPLMVDIRNINSISPEAREHFTLKGRETVINSFAIVHSSALSRIIGNFFLTFNAPPIPVRLFKREEKAYV